MSERSIMRLEKEAVIRLLHDEPAFSELLLHHMLSRNIRIEEDLVDQLFNSSEKRLARVLLLLANFAKDGNPDPVIPKISQETLAEMVGTIRSRVSFFMTGSARRASCNAAVNMLAAGRFIAPCSTSSCMTDRIVKTHPSRFNCHLSVANSESSAPRAIKPIQHARSG
jgi:hypothetical protein